MSQINEITVINHYLKGVHPKVFMARSGDYEIGDAVDNALYTPAPGEGQRSVEAYEARYQILVDYIGQAIGIEEEEGEQFVEALEFLNELNIETVEQADRAAAWYTEFLEHLIAIPSMGELVGAYNEGMDPKTAAFALR